ncbi:MAG: hypothetical protein O7G85_01290 [Planctomycetota bacterium]|nr:hypothetical protein [Planctomycetota bacterium]
MSDLVFILIQALLAIIGIRLMLLGVYPRLERIRHPQLVTDIWGPIAIVTPMLVMAGRIDGDVVGIGWIAIGGPLLCAMLALGIGLLARRAGSPEMMRMPESRVLAIWIIGGVIYLLLSVAHELTVWTGQALFAVGAVLLWINTPIVGSVVSSNDRDERKAGSSLMLCMLCALGQGIAGYLAGSEWAGISGAMMVVYATILLAGAAVMQGPDLAFRLGGWAATFGMMFGLGITSLLFMMPSVLGALAGGEATTTTRVAHGFGAYIYEAMGLLILGPVILALPWVSRSTQRRFGVGVLFIAASLAAWRLTSI